MSHEVCPVYIWKCTFCGHKEYSKHPPVSCVKCAGEANRFIMVPPPDKALNQPAVIYPIGMPTLNSILYLVGSTQGGQVNAMCCSSVTPVTYHPMRVAVAVNKNNLTYDFIKVSGVFSLCLLGLGHKQMAHHFGRNSGRNINKFEKYSQKPGKTGSPIIDGCLGYFECEVDHRATMDLDTHTLFVARVVDAFVESNEPPLTYRDYAQDLSKY